MYVSGFAITSRGASTPTPSRPSATSATALRCREKRAPTRVPSRSATRNPTLCRLPAYSRPGFPSPTTSHGAVCSDMALHAVTPVPDRRIRDRRADGTRRSGLGGLLGRRLRLGRRLGGLGGLELVGGRRGGHDREHQLR